MSEFTGVPEGANTYSAGTNTNPWTEIKISVPASDIDLAGDIAQMTVPYGIYIEDYRFLEEETMEIAHIDLIDEDLLAKNRDCGIVHIYIEPGENPAEAVAFLRERFAEAHIENEIELILCKNEDWQNNWKKFFKPTNIGSRLTIQPVWEDEDRGTAEDGRKMLKIEPGLAFGTGSHDTTRLCLETLEEKIAGGETVLDLGCGSGILSIAALLLGAKSAEGVDIDELAVKTAVQNGELNGFKEPQYKVHCGDMAEKITGTYDIVVANIVADIIVLFCENAKKFMHDDSIFIVSGIISSREQDVLSAFEQNGFAVLERKQSAEWLCFVVK
ncbi:MAG: 50S ribosomal protein L11 methyltransferase [Clostridia bacterium]|nr:50S ribosomal protein L11 methyltransferase [Clostridia bacterium]